LITVATIGDNSKKRRMTDTMEIDPDGSNKSLADSKKDEGNELYKTKNYIEALQRYSEAISLDPDCPAYYGNRSACHMMLSQYPQALADAKTSVSLDAAFVKGYIRMAKCCLTLGDTVTAGQALDKAAGVEPKNAAVIQERNNVSTLERFKTDSQTAYDARDYRKALFCLDRALTTATACRQLKTARAECLAFLGRYAESQEVANDLLRMDHMNADAIYVRGLCLYYEDNVDKAFTHFQQVLRLAPDHQKAKDVYKKAKLLKQKKDEGNTVFKMSNWSAAYEIYTEALGIDPCNKFTNAKLYCNRAIVAAKLNKLKESVSDCSAALELDDGYLKAILRRAKSYMELEEFDQAVADYDKAHRLDRTNGEYRRLLQHSKLELKKSKRKDYYKILGVNKGANEEEIKKAYRKRALVHHPDRHAGATDDEKKEHEKKFKEVGEAYGVLSDTKKRTRYDNGHDLEDLEGHGGGGGGHPFAQDIDPNHIFQAFFGGQGGGGGMGGHGQQGQQQFGAGGQGFSFQFG
jgi:DnaJ family protein C protein 7